MFTGEQIGPSQSEPRIKIELSGDLEKNGAHAKHKREGEVQCGYPRNMDPSAWVGTTSRSLITNIAYAG